MKLTGQLMVFGSIPVVTDLIKEGVTELGYVTNSGDIAMERDETLIADNDGSSIGTATVDQRQTVSIDVSFKFANKASIDKFKDATSSDFTIPSIGDLVTLVYSDPLLRTSKLTGWEITALSRNIAAGEKSNWTFELRRFEDGFATTGIWEIDAAGSVTETAAP
jgi:hypothetical protein